MTTALAIRPALPVMTNGLPAHCGGCLHGGSEMIGTERQCALDGVVRSPSIEDCAHPLLFVEDMRPFTERFPGYPEPKLTTARLLRWSLRDAVRNGDPVMNVGGLAFVPTPVVPIEVSPNYEGAGHAA